MSNFSQPQSWRSASKPTNIPSSELTKKNGMRSEQQRGGGGGGWHGGTGAVLLFMRPAAAGNINLLEIKKNKKVADSESVHQADEAREQFLKM